MENINWEKPWTIRKNDFSPRAWDAKSPAELGGLIEMAGGNIDDYFGTKNIKHPLLGKTVDLPMGRCIITNIITHPYGKLLFDVQFEQPAPHFFVNDSKMYYTYLEKKYIDYMSEYWRGFGDELHRLIIMKALENGEVIPEDVINDYSNFDFIHKPHSEETRHAGHDYAGQRGNQYGI